MGTTRDFGYISAYPVIVAYESLYGIATGGTSSSITVSGQPYTLLTFTSDGNLVVSQSGLFDVLMFAGGAGGASGQSGTGRGGGGGGAGGVILSTLYLAAATYAVDVGAGGSGSFCYGKASCFLLLFYFGHFSSITQ